MGVCLHVQEASFLNALLSARIPAAVDERLKAAVTRGNLCKQLGSVVFILVIWGSFLIRWAPWVRTSPCQEGGHVLAATSGLASGGGGRDYLHICNFCTGLFWKLLVFGGSVCLKPDCIIHKSI